MASPTTLFPSPSELLHQDVDPEAETPLQHRLRWYGDKVRKLHSARGWAPASSPGWLRSGCIFLPATSQASSPSPGGDGQGYMLDEVAEALSSMGWDAEVVRGRLIGWELKPKAEEHSAPRKEQSYVDPVEEWVDDGALGAGPRLTDPMTDTGRFSDLAGKTFAANMATAQPTVRFDKDGAPIPNWPELADVAHNYVANAAAYGVEPELQLDYRLADFSTPGRDFDMGPQPHALEPREILRDTVARVGVGDTDAVRGDTEAAAEHQIRSLTDAKLDHVIRKVTSEAGLWANEAGRLEFLTKLKAELASRPVALTSDIGTRITELGYTEADFAWFHDPVTWNRALGHKATRNRIDLSLGHIASPDFALTLKALSTEH
jgi:hypothetical protein